MGKAVHAKEVAASAVKTISPSGDLCLLMHTMRAPNGLEMSRPASAQIAARIRLAAAGRVGSIELLGRLFSASPVG
jgi:hypothetical protein